MKKIIAILSALSIIFALATVAVGAECTHADTVSESFDATCASRAKTVYTCDCGYTETVYAEPELTLTDGKLNFAFEGQLCDGVLTVTCTSYNNPGICGSRFTVYYNADALTPLSMANGEVWDEDVVVLTVNESKSYVKFFAEDWGNNASNGTVFTATFEVKDIPANWGIKLETIAQDFCDWDTGSLVSYAVKSTVTDGYGDHVWGEGVATVLPTVYDEGVAEVSCTLCSATSTEAIPALERWNKGDLNSDGRINLADIFMAKSYLTNGDISYGSQLYDAADMNDDRNFNLSDIMMLKSELIK